MSLGGSSQKSSSETNRFGYNQSTSALDPQQLAAQQQNVQGFRDQLQQYQGGNFGGGQAQMQRQQNQLFNQNANIAGNNDLDSMRFQRQFAQQGNPYEQAMIANFGQDIAQQYNRMLPGLGGEYAAAGQRGSSRQGIAEGLLGQGAMQQFAQGANNLRFQGYQDQGIQAQNAVQNQFGLREQQLNAIQQGSNLQQQNQALQFNPFVVGQQVIGTPTALTNSFGFDIAESKSKGKGAAANIGFN